MQEGSIPYENYVQTGLRTVIKAALEPIANSGSVLPGDHFFYITFLTNAKGVVIPDHAKPEGRNEITIALQHRFWNLEVTDEVIKVDVSFNNVITNIIIPYEAITDFIDPSVEFALHFEGSINLNEKTSNVPTEEKPIIQDNPETNIVTVDFARKG